MKPKWLIGRLDDWLWTIGFLGLLLIVLSSWAYSSPRAYNHGRDFVIDATVTWFWLWITFILLVATVQCRAELSKAAITEQLRGYASMTVVALLAVLMCWNLVALYTEMGIVPITWFGYQVTARPVLLFGVLALALVLIFFGMKWFGKPSKLAETKASETSPVIEWGETRQKGKLSFILHHGVLWFGTLFGLIFCINAFSQGQFSFWEFAFAILAGWLGGALISWVQWHYSEKEYLKATDSSE